MHNAVEVMHKAIVLSRSTFENTGKNMLACLLLDFFSGICRCETKTGLVFHTT